METAYKRVSKCLENNGFKIALSQPTLSASGDLTLSAYVDAGPDTQGAYVIQVSVMDAHGQVVTAWDGKTLSELPKTNFANEYLYSVFSIQANKIWLHRCRRCTCHDRTATSKKFRSESRVLPSFITGYRWEAMEDGRSRWRTVSW